MVRRIIPTTNELPDLGLPVIRVLYICFCCEFANVEERRISQCCFRRKNLDIFFVNKVKDIQTRNNLAFSEKLDEVIHSELLITLMPLMIRILKPFPDNIIIPKLEVFCLLCFYSFLKLGEWNLVF